MKPASLFSEPPLGGCTAFAVQSATTRVKHTTMAAKGSKQCEFWQSSTMPR